MDEDPRFPNRKKKRDWDMSALDKPADADKQDQGTGETDEPELPVNVYHVVETAPKNKEEELAERADLYSFRASVGPAQQTPTPFAESPVFHAPLPEAQVQKPPQQGWKERIRKFAESQARVYAAIGVGLGVLLGVIVASLTLFMGPPNGRYDLGSVTSSAADLKGHLFVEWDKKLNYRLLIEPGDADRQAAFALAAAHSPRPLSIEIHVQDSEGFVLCSKEILLKYDARNALELAPSNPDAQDEKTNAGAAPAGQPAQAIDLAQADAQEAAREQGRDLFKNQTGPDGQVTAIGAQGTIPCTAKAYEKAASWSFSPNFPAVAEQDEWVERQKEIDANGGRPPAAKSAARRGVVAAKPVAKLLPFSIEGDDTIVDFDPSRGVIETGSGKAFFIDKASGAASDPRWQDYPVDIHYRCDRSSECVIIHAGAGALHARLR
jgi:hypothetical protein